MTSETPYAKDEYIFLMFHTLAHQHFDYLLTHSNFSLFVRFFSIYSAWSQNFKLIDLQIAKAKKDA